MSNPWDTLAVEMRRRAAVWRKRHGFEGKGGYVVYYNGEPEGWTVDLGCACDWTEGCFAIPEDPSPLHLVTSDSSAAKEWQQINPPPGPAACAPPDPLWEATEMDGLSCEKQALRAILHVLGQVRDRPEVGYWLGIGTQSYALLTEAAAALLARNVAEVRKQFVCRNAERPGKEDAERLEWLRDRLVEMPPPYADLLGLPRGWKGDLREAIDAARGKD